MTPFCFTKDILNNKEYIMKTEIDEEEYVPFVVNRVMSNYPDTIFYAQEMNCNPHLAGKLQFDYLFHSIRKAKRPFVPYPKKEKSEYISLIAECYNYSYKKAKEALAILTEEQVLEIKKIYEKGGTTK